jgi:hypothetical protein
VCLVSDLCGAPSISIDFDAVSAPCLFAWAEPLTDQLAEHGVVWQGHGAVLDACASFEVAGFSGPSFVGYSDVAQLSDGSATRTDDAMELLCPVDRVALFVAAELDSDFSVRALDGSDVVVDERLVGVGAAGARLELTGPGIVRVEYDNQSRVGGGVAPRFVVDDVEIAIPEPGTLSLRVAAVATLVALLAWRRRVGRPVDPAPSAPRARSGERGH